MMKFVDVLKEWKGQLILLCYWKVLNREMMPSNLDKSLASPHLHRMGFYFDDGYKVGKRNTGEKLMEIPPIIRMMIAHMVKKMLGHSGGQKWQVKNKK